VICTSDNIIFLQITLSGSHTVKTDSLDLVYDNLPQGLKSGRALSYVYVAPNIDAVSSWCCQNTAKLRGWNPKLHVYYCVYDGILSGLSQTSLLDFEFNESEDDNMGLEYEDEDESMETESS
jgi:hypothetical protein